MFDKNNIPDLYKKMNDLGYLAYDIPDHSKYIWMNDMEWMAYEEVMNYCYEEGEINTILPFAFTGGGDKWVFVDNGSKEPFIALCYHDTGDGEYYAKNFEDAVLRNIIEYAAQGKTEEELNPSDFSFYEEELRGELKDYGKAYKGLICKEYLDIIDSLSELPLKKTEEEGDVRYALLSYDEADKRIEQYLDFELLDQEFDWWSPA